MMNTLNSAFLYDPQLSQYQLSETHPFKPIRLEMTRSLLEHCELLPAEALYSFDVLDESWLYKIHSQHYVEMVKRVSSGETEPSALDYGLGTGDNPIFPDMHEAIWRVCSATTKAADLVMSGKVQRALNLSGGLHHALKDKASGFCLYSDLAVAMQFVIEHYQARIAYIDIDAHHGDGVQWLFYERNDVMTISLHESGRYLFPGTGHTYEVGKGKGRGHSVNLPLEPYTEDDSFLAVLEQTVPQALRSFQPDLIVLQAGADMHRFDPLADLALSTHGMVASYQRISDLADELCNGRLVATGGGGYDAYRTVPRAWAFLWAILSRQTMPEDTPLAWLEQWQPLSPDSLPETIHDAQHDWSPIPRRNEIERQNLATARRLQQTLEPIWQEVFS